MCGDYLDEAPRHAWHCGLYEGAFISPVLNPAMPRSEEFLQLLSVCFGAGGHDLGQNPAEDIRRRSTLRFVRPRCVRDEAVVYSPRRCGPSSLHIWLSQCTPVFVDHLKTACSRPSPQQCRTCLFPFLGSAELLSIAFVPIPYLAISIHVCSAHDRGAAIRPHQGIFEGQHGGYAIAPVAPVCWLTPRISVSAMLWRSPRSSSFSM